MHRRAEELSVLNALSRQVSASLSLDEVVEAALEGVADCVAPDVAMLYLRRGESLLERRRKPCKSKNRQTYRS